MVQVHSGHTRIASLLKDIAGLQAGPGTRREKSAWLVEAGRELQAYIELEEFALREGRPALDAPLPPIHKAAA